MCQSRCGFSEVTVVSLSLVQLSHFSFSEELYYTKTIDALSRKKGKG